MQCMVIMTLDQWYMEVFVSSHRQFYPKLFNTRVLWRADCYWTRLPSTGPWQGWQDIQAGALSCYREVDNYDNFVHDELLKLSIDIQKSI